MRQKPKRRTAYDTNDTMKMLGYSLAWQMIMPGARYRKALEDVLAARVYADQLDLAFDVFILGMFAGIHEERRHRRTGVRSWTED